MPGATSSVTWDNFSEKSQNTILRDGVFSLPFQETPAGSQETCPLCLSAKNKAGANRSRSRDSTSSSEKNEKSR